MRRTDALPSTPQSPLNRRRAQRGGVASGVSIIDTASFSAPEPD